MNRYPVWKYVVIVIAMLVGTLYTLPNFFGESPAVQISSAKPAFKVDSNTLARVEAALKAAGIAADVLTLEGASIKARFGNTETQLKAKDAIQKALVPEPANPGYVVALNLLSASPGWLTGIHALPMYLGLDLRGGVHFLMQVDMKAALSKKLDAYTNDIRGMLREQRLQYSGLAREGQSMLKKSTKRLAKVRSQSSSKE